MTTSTDTRQPASRRRSHRAKVAAVLVTVGGLGATAIALDHRTADAPRPAATLQTDTSRYFTADAVEQWLSPYIGPTPFACRPDAAQRWQVPNIAIPDLPYTADAAEAWLTPEIAVRDLPYSADAAEHWLCAP
jgi:hypothetical protein